MYSAPPLSPLICPGRTNFNLSFYSARTYACVSHQVSIKIATARFGAQNYNADMQNPIAERVIGLAPHLRAADFVCFATVSRKKQRVLRNYFFASHYCVKGNFTLFAL